MNKPVATVGEQFSSRLTREAVSLSRALSELTAGSGWDVDRRDIYGALPHDLRRPDGWDILRALEALRIPFTLQECKPPDAGGQPVLCIRPDATWAVRKAFNDPRPQWEDKKTYYAYVHDVDDAELRAAVTDPSEIIDGLKPTVLSLLVTSLIVNLMGITSVVFVVLIYNFAVPSQSVSVLLAILCGLALFTAVELVARSVRSSVMVRMASDMEHRMGLSLVHKLISLPLVVLQGSDVFQQRMRLRQFEGMRDALLGPIGQATLDLPFLAIYAAIVFVLSPGAGALLTGGAALILVVFVLFQPGLRARWSRRSEASTAYRKRVSEVVEQQEAIRGLGIETVWHTRLAQAHEAYLNASLEAQRHAQMSSTILQGLVTATGITAGVLVTYQTMTGALSLGSLVGMVVLVWRFLMPLQSIAHGAEQLQSFLHSKLQFEDTFALQSERYRGVEPKIAPPIKPPVVFDQVTLRFSDSIVPPLLGVSLRLEAGTITSVSGPAMSGKTKLAELIAGLYAPTGGQVLINGADVRQIPVDDLRAAIAYAPQKARMLYGSIAQNLDFALPGVSEDLMWRALLEAGIDGYIRKLPDGLSTRLSTDVSRVLPHGVQKGLGLAQSFLKPGPIYIFDEPRFGTEPDQAVFIRAALRARREKGAVLLISNDPGDLDLADRHVFLDKGRLILNDRAGRGRPRLEALLKRNSTL